MVTVGNSRRETTSVYLTPGLLSTDVGGVRAVSTTEQNPDHQTDALLRAGVGRDDIHVDHASGAKVSRPKLDLILRVPRDEDVMVVDYEVNPAAAQVARQTWEPDVHGTRPRCRCPRPGQPQRRDSPMADPIGKAPRTYTAT